MRASPSGLLERLRPCAAWLALALPGGARALQAPAKPPEPPPPPASPRREPEPPPPPSAPAPPAAPAAPAAPADSAATPPGPPLLQDPLAATRPDLLGAWSGEAGGARDSLFLLVGFTKDAQGAWAMAATVPQALAVNQRVSQLTVTEGRRFEGELTSAAAALKLRGELAADGSRVDGEAEISFQGMPPQLRSFSLRPTVHPRQVPQRSIWTTTLQVPGAALEMQMTLADAGPLGWVGSMDIPAQGLGDFPVLVKRRGSGTLDVTVPVANPATMVLEPSADGTRLTGTFTQGVAVPVTFVRQSGEMAGVKRRPQDPVPPYPYREREVLIRCEGGHALAGTLLLPPAASPDARVGGVVLLTGSGAQDRNESLMGHRPFLVIADALARAGLAVLRCDDRGVGGSTGASAEVTSEDLAEDARAMIKHLRSHAEVDPGLCGIVGHSEGGLTGPMAALAEQEAGRPLAFVVMLAGPGVSGRELLKTQMRRIIEAEGVKPSAADEVLDRQSRLLDAVVAGMPEEELLGMMTALVNAQLALNAGMAGMPAPPPVPPTAPVITTGMAQLTSPWMRTFLALDPRDTLAALKCPVLAMNGTLDTQVDVAQNLTEVERVRTEAGMPVTARKLEGLNHLFQPAVSGAVSEYATIDVTFEPSALAEMVAWIRGTVDALAATRPPPFRPVRMRDRAAP